MGLRQDLEKWTPRKEQKEALDFIENAIKKDNNKFILLDLPTGVGKSYLALMFADWYKKNVNPTAQFDVLTNSKILQDQYVEEFSSIADLKGKENYECDSFGCSCAQGKEFAKLKKIKCEDCPYDYARNRFLAGDISLTNYYLYIMYVLYVPELLKERGASVLIVDEAHCFDDVFSDFISIKITETIIKRYKFENEYEIIRKFKSISDISEYTEFLKWFKIEIEANITSIENKMGVSLRKMATKATKRDVKLDKVFGTKNTEIKMAEMVSDLEQWSTKIDIFMKEFEASPINWVIESSWNEKTKSKEFSLEPIWAYDYLDKYVWSKYDHVILMSGTILDKSLFCYLNGLDESKTSYHRINSPFPLENRPIFYMPLGKMSFTKKEETFQNYVPYIKRLLNKYQSKGIIHTNSFELSKWIQNEIDNERLLFHDSTNKDKILREHLETKDNTVLVSPSMAEGVSLDGDLSRFQIIAKVPYPSLASNKNKMRQKINPDVYTWKTISGILQMYGRSIRSSTDKADTIILDGSFGDLMKYSSHMFPNWFGEAIQRINAKIS